MFVITVSSQHLLSRVSIVNTIIKAHDFYKSVKLYCNIMHTVNNLNRKSQLNYSQCFQISTGFDWTFLT